jgi:hypothetical protein
MASGIEILETLTFHDALIIILLVRDVNRACCCTERRLRPWPIVEVELSMGPGVRRDDRRGGSGH